MRDNFKVFNFLKFDYLDNSTGKTTLKCNIKFASQVPNDATLKERAVFISFTANSDDDVMHLIVYARVEYSFSESTMPKEDAFLDEYYLDAYDVFRDRVKQVFAALGKESLSLPDAPID